MIGALVGKRRSSRSIRSAYEGQLRASYGDFRSPRLHFVMATADRQPFEGVLRDLAQIHPVVDDTDLNCDVCFSYIVRADQPLVVKLSLVGPYAVILSFGSDGFGEGSLAFPSHPAGTTDDARVASVLNSHGFMLVPAEHLETLVPLALVKDRAEVTLYAALFEPGVKCPGLMTADDARLRRPP